MPENLNDTAATKEQNDIYLRDPTNPGGKPFSIQQQRSNEAAKRKTMLYSEDHPTKGVVFDIDEAPDAMADGWVDAPLVHPNNPNPVVEPVQDTELKALWAEVDRIGVTPRPHHRSGKEKLMKAITDYG